MQENSFDISFQLPEAPPVDILVLQSREQENCMENTIKFGISACLLGQKVRYDGGHKLDLFLRDTLGQYVEYLPVCPEVECGLSVPREPMRLVGDPNAPRLVTIRGNYDYTPKMTQWAKMRLDTLKRRGLSGFILKSNSPSCGLKGVKIHHENGRGIRKGRGIFAGLFVKHFPIIPSEEETLLHNPILREDFIERAFTIRRWLEVSSRKRSFKKLVDFHCSHRLLILSRSREHLGIMERVIKTEKRVSVRELYDLYEELLTESLKRKTTPRKNVRVLQRAVGYLGKDLAEGEKQELIEVTQAYGECQVPLLVPITLFNHFARKYDCHDLSRQVFLRPHPAELHLRNHA